MNELNSRLDRIIQKAGKLYTLPAVALKVLELAEQPQLDPRELKQTIEKDPALTCKLLRIVNSPLFGLTRQVFDLQQAIGLLGIRPLKMLTLGFCLPENLTANGTAAVLAQYWRHTLLRAVAARELAEKYWRLPADEAFLAGLLRDLGSLVLIQILGLPYENFLAQYMTAGPSRLVRETTTFGFNHCQLSARLLEQWGLPSALVRDIDASGRGESEPLSWSVPLAEVLRIADLIAGFMTQADTSVLGPLLQQTTQSGLLQRDELVAMIHELEQKVEELADTLAVPFPTGADHHALVKRAQSLLAEAADEGAYELLKREKASTDQETKELWEQTVSLTNAMMAFDGTRRAKGEEPGMLRRPSAVFVDPLGEADERPEPIDENRREQVLNRIGEVALDCRAKRSGFSLLLVEIDPIDDDEFDIAKVDPVRKTESLLAHCRRMDHDGLECLNLSPIACAVLLPGADRISALALGNQLLRAARDRQTASIVLPLSLSVGLVSVEMPGKSFRPEESLSAAERCLRIAQKSGGTLKSIGVY